MVDCKQIDRFGVDPIIPSLGVIPPFCPHGETDLNNSQEDCPLKERMRLVTGSGILPISFFPHYNHGPLDPHSWPTLLFKRYYPDREPREFYACAVHRDRKGCSFFHYKDEVITKEKRDRWKKAFDEQQLPIRVETSEEKLKAIESLSFEQRYYCPRCSLLLCEEELPTHDNHGVTQGVTDAQLREPTTFLQPVDNSKSQAQFYFSDSSLCLLKNELKRLQFTQILCIGTPRLHEAFTKEGKIKSLLLDIDHRYASFYTTPQYQQYNMFNHFFYASGGQDVCREFLTASPSTTAIVIDPPFGGLADILAVTIRKLWEISGTELTIFLIFPYFLEVHVTSALPTLWMMDYQVTYLNHKHFGASRKKPKPSPVRVFTNLALPGFKLPSKEGYRMCKLCNRFVSEMNAHCSSCATCSSKDGRPYIHCEKCDKCVKQSRVHCAVCNRCELPAHVCANKIRMGCHICGSVEHKRKDCTERECYPPRKKKGKRK